MKKIIASAALAIGITFATLTPAHAGQYGPPQYGDHVSYWNCSGPYRNPYNYYSQTPYYRCWADYDLWAEWFRGEVDRWVSVPGVYYA